jgi:hypothetical protein
MRKWISVLILAVGAVLAACQGGSTQKCSFSERTELAQPSTTLVSSTWPKFRADPANSGRAAVNLGTTVPQIAELLFDGYCSIADTQTTLVCTAGENNCPINQPCVRIGTTQTTPIVSQNGDTELVFVASSDGTVYFTSVAGTAPTFVDPIQVQGTIVGSPLLGADGTLYVPSNNAISRFITNGTADTNGTVQNGAGLTGFVVASPNIWNNDGTVFIGSQTGNFPAVCSNGVPRFVVTVPANPTTAIVVQDPNKTDVTAIIVVGGVNGQVRAYNLSGNQIWSFFASANINAALVADLANPTVDPTNPLFSLFPFFYVADSAGRVFAASLKTGQAISEFEPPQDIGPISASPALGRDAPGTIPKLYVAGQNGILYALNRTPGDDYGHVCWFLDTGGQINSSPAVATGGAQDVIIVAADATDVLTPGSEPVVVGGKVFAVTDDNRCPPTGDPPFPREADWIVVPGAREGHELGYSIGTSSPAIGPDGTVYIGRSGSRLGLGDECPSPTPCVGEFCPTPAPTPGPCVVNEGGALYAIGGG